MRVAAIDIGSNSVRMLVADVADPDGPIATVARAGEVCRLARGLGRNGTIEAELAERAGELVGEFARRSRNLGARHLVVGATAALRSAGNGVEVAGIIGRRAGVDVRILSGDDEARLVYRSVVLGLGRTARSSACVVFDLGGGSTEVVSGFGDRAGRWTSLPFGAVNLTERHLHHDPPVEDEMLALEADVDAQIMHQCALFPERTAVLAGVGGTITVLASLDRGLESYEPSLIEGWSVTPERLEALIANLAGAGHADRRRLKVMGEGRADIVVAGALVVRCLARRFPSAGLVCSTQGLRYGLARLAAEEGASAGGFGH
jgi:exopolyphosphatase/guanosine-5'-triphosphate,3'-diphosphate pyrophosphatase